MSAIVKYNGRTVATIPSNNKATLPIAEKRMETDLEIEALEDELLLQTKTTNVNGTVTSDPGYDGLSAVIVNVPTQEITDPVLVPLVVSQNGVYNDPRASIVESWDSTMQYTIPVPFDDNTTVYFRKAGRLYVPDNWSDLDAYVIKVTSSLGDEYSGTLAEAGLVDLMGDGSLYAGASYVSAYTIWWVKDASTVNGSLGLTLEDNTVYVSNVQSQHYNIWSVSVTTPSNAKADGFLPVTVNVESSGGDSALPIEVSTESEMTALLESGEVGGVYKYTGTTGTYENGALYLLEAEADALQGTWVFNDAIEFTGVTYSGIPILFTSLNVNYDKMLIGHGNSPMLIRINYYIDDEVTGVYTDSGWIDSGFKTINVDTTYAELSANYEYAEQVLTFFQSNATKLPDTRLIKLINQTDIEEYDGTITIV